MHRPIIASSSNIKATASAKQSNNISIKLEESGTYTGPTLYKQEFKYNVKGKLVVEDALSITEKLGPSNKFKDSVIKSYFIFPNVQTVPRVGGVEDGYLGVPVGTTIEAKLCDSDNIPAPGQSSMIDAGYPVIINMEQLDSAVAYTYPFSSYPIGLNYVYLSAENLMSNGDGWLETDDVKTVKMVMETNGVAVVKKMPYKLTNLIGRDDPEENMTIENEGKQMADNISKEVGVGSLFKDVSGGDMLEMGMKFFSGVATGGAVNVGMLIAPTVDPTIYKIVLSVDNGGMSDDDENGFSADFTDEESMSAIRDALLGGDEDRKSVV